MIPDPVATFITRWTHAQSSERANYGLFLSELCDVLGVPRPDPATDDTANNAYVFERAVTFRHRGGKTSTGRIDLYKRGCFVLEAKQYASAKTEAAELALALGDDTPKSPKIARGTAAWDRAMLEALGQADNYARNLPDDEDPPPFLLVVDVGHVIELYSDFTQKGKNYVAYPDARSHRIRLADLANSDLRERLRLVWTDPLALDPAKKAAAVTREVAGYLAELAKSFEKHHEPKLVAEFLSRCLFCMFAEDVGLLPKESFHQLLESVKADPGAFVPLMEMLFEDMNQGRFSGLLRKKLLYFNGGLFASARALPVNGAQLGLLRKAAALEWRNVEPAIFGTLLERALSPDERHKLGAHYTPRSYVERLVLPTVIEPLREEWQSVRTAAVTLASRGTDADLKKAQQEVRTFHGQLCAVRVLDPACGSGNFLYVALEQMKRLEGEIIALLHDLGDQTDYLNLQGSTVDPHQFLGIELNARAAAIAELVLWIGYLQGHFRVHGDSMPAEPVLKKFANIECRDAVLAYDKKDFAKDAAGKIRYVWNRKTTKTDPVTGREVPDDQAVIPLETFSNPRPATWPQADFIVGNPPFLGTARMREDLGVGYTETLRAAYPTMPESADFVMFWWHKAALETLAGRARRFGFITTNSIRQTFNRRVVQAAMDQGLYLTFAIPDHPWIDATECAAVRIAMSVGALSPTVGAALRRDGPASESRDKPAPTTGALPKGLTVGPELASGRSAERHLHEVEPYAESPGHLHHVTAETPHEETGENEVQLDLVLGKVSADLTAGANVAATQPLKANDGLSSPGVKLHGSGFIVTPDEAKALGLGKVKGLESHLRPYRNGRDLADRPRDVMVIDLFGLTVEEVRERFPKVYEHVLRTVKPERDQNNRASYRDLWWVHGEPRRELRPALAGLPRYIATIETAKHRFFQFLDAAILPDNKLVVIALKDAFHLGVLSSRIHATFALSRGALLEDRPVYPKSECFDPFPFPDCTEKQKARIRALAEELDAHRKRAQQKHGLGLTDIYNVLEKVRGGAGRPGTLSETPKNPSAVRGGARSPSALSETPQPLSDSDPKPTRSEIASHLSEKIVRPPLVGVPSDVAGAAGPGSGHPIAKPPGSASPATTLTAKERAIHDAALVSTLKQLHDDLDAAVADAYGWPWPLTDAEILERVVALNTARAAEEAQGTIRWLRPEYQLSAARGQKPVQSALDLADDVGSDLASGRLAGRHRRKAEPYARAKKVAWPKTLAERAKAVEAALTSAEHPLTAIALAKLFTRAKAEDVQEILETLVALGRARAGDDKDTFVR